MLIYPTVSTFGNYSSIRRQLTQTWVSPQYISATEGFKALNPSEKRTYHALSRDLFRSSPSIRSSIVRKNSWACGIGWTPNFKGEDKKYGKLLTEYLTEVVYPNCNIMGGNYTFNRTLQAIANEIDVGGDCLVIFVQGRDGLLKMSVYPSSVIGQRQNKDVVESGRYSGANIFDGVVYDRNNSPIAYSILEDDKEEDYFVSAANSSVLFEPVEGQSFRGVSIIAAALRDSYTVTETEGYLARQCKMQAKAAIKFGTKDGTGAEFVQQFAVGQPEVTGSCERQRPTVIDEGDFVFVDAKNNEGAEAFDLKAPGKDMPDWLRTMEEKVLYQLGWHLALISPGKINTSNARAMEAQVNQHISERQQTLKRIAKTYCIASIAKGIENGDLPAPKGNSADWRKIDFNMPPLFQLDSYYGAQTDMQQLKVGNTSLRRVVAKSGGDWQEIRAERQEEADDSVTRAKELVAKHPELSFERALDLISQLAVNAAPVQQQPIQTEGE